MTRLTVSANTTAIAQPHVPYVLLAQFDFSSGFVRVNSSDRSFTHLSNTYSGLGTLGAIGGVRENDTLTPEKLEFQLSGVDSSLLTSTLTEHYHGRDATLWIGYLTSDLQLAGTPEILWEGYMDVMTIRTDTNQSTISLVCENRLIAWNKAADFLYTYEHQILFDATDKFFDQVPLLPNKSIRWGDHVPPGYTPDPRGGPYW